MVIESDYPTLDIPEVDIWRLLFERDVPFPVNKPIYVDSETHRQYTFHDVKDTASAFGHALRTQWNWKKGDVIAVFARNCIDTPALTWGTIWAEGVVTPANPAYSATELAVQLKDSDSKALITEIPLLETALAAAERAGISQSRILVMGEKRNGKGPVLHITDLISQAKNIPRARRVIQSVSELAFLCYSSGTSGLPKGVMLTHGNIVSNLLMIDAAQGFLKWNGGPDGSGDNLVAVLPFYHVYGLAVLMHHSIYAGLKIVVFPSFALEAFCQAIQEHKITFAYLAPPIILGLCKSPLVDNYDLTSITGIMSAAAPLPMGLIHEVWERLKIPVLQGYGMTEMSPATHIQSLKHWKTTIGSVGRLLPNQTAKVVSETGEELPIGSTGEIWIKGPNMFAGYWKNPTATAQCMTRDGYYMTGDIGYHDRCGNFYITDRLKELIKYKGFQVAPAELEGLLVGSEMVADACVVGIYDEGNATELPMAFIVKSAKAKALENGKVEKEILKWVDERVANHKRLRAGIRFLDEIPKSGAGKILRRILRDRTRSEAGEQRVTAAKL